MGRVLVVANETLAGRSLIDAVRARVEQGDRDFYLVVPQARPRHGNVVYDDAVRDAAQVRIDLAKAFMASQEGVQVDGEPGDPDPYTAAMDAISDLRPDHVIVSTHPATASGWLRRDLVERLEHDAGVPVQHVVVDLEREGRPFAVTLVVANRTMGGRSLVDALKAKTKDEERVFILCVPLEDGSGSAVASGRRRLAGMLQQLRAEGLVCAGMIADPDPYTATMNALQWFHFDDIVISTLSETRSGWLRADLIQRVAREVACPVEHVVSEAATAGAGS